jgi:hypothetical protein
MPGIGLSICMITLLGTMAVANRDANNLMWEGSNLVWEGTRTLVCRKNVLASVSLAMMGLLCAIPLPFRFMMDLIEAVRHHGTIPAGCGSGSVCTQRSVSRWPA